MTGTTGTAAKVVCHRVGDVAEVVITAPPLNLVDLQFMDDLESVLATLPGSARAVLLRAEGKVFCAGVDVSCFLERDTSAGAALMQRYLSAVHALEALPVPTLAVVHGLCLTIGLELTLGCDLLWAADEAEFGLVEATVGLTPGGGGTQRLVARAGVARAAEVVLTGRTYPAEVFRQWGVVNAVHPRSELLERARAEAAALAAGPTAAAALGKEILRAARDGGVGAADAMSSETSGQAFATEDLIRGVTSLLTEGPRKATFVGR